MSERVTMPLDHLSDALGDMVDQFCHEMYRSRVKSMPPREWAANFRSWFDEFEFERQYLDTLKWLGESPSTSTEG